MKHEFALSAKLLTLDIGHTIYLEDGGSMARQVSAIVGRHAILKQRKFFTSQCDVIRDRQLQPVLMIKRID